MRIGFAYSKQPKWPKNGWVAQALRDAGHEVTRIATADDLRRADAECDVVLFSQKGAGLPHADVMSAAKGRQAVWACWVFDLMAMRGRGLQGQSTLFRTDYAQRPILNSFATLLAECDIVFVKERGLLADYHRLGIKAVWLDQGCPCGMPATEYADAPEYDVLLWGCTHNEWRERRNDVAALVNAGYVVAWAGAAGPPVVGGSLPLQFCPPFELPSLISKAAVVLCCDMRHDIDGYWSDRFWLATGAGACVVRRSTPGLPPGPYLHYSNHEQLILHVGYLRTEPEVRRSLGRAARSWTFRSHLVGNRVKELVERCRAIVEKKSAASAKAQAR